MHTLNDTPALRASGLGRRYGRQWALARVELEVEPGEALLLAGANGSGKSTFLRLAAGLENPSRGELEVFGRSPQRERSSCRRMISMVSHSAYLYERLNALETVRLWARLLGKPHGDRDLRPLLEEVGLDGAAQKPAIGFSAGMRKRLALARTRLENPRLVLLDEPFSALDAEGKRLVESWIADFRRRGVTMLMASHSLARAGRLCERAVLLERGQVAWRGPAAEVAARLGETV